MTTAELRRNQIVAMVNSQGHISVTDLARELSVTTATIRTDLNALEEEHLVIRSHGGAIPAVGRVINLKEDIKEQRNRDLKARIGAAATRLIDPDDSITLATGSTMLTFAKSIVPQGNLTILTSALRIAMHFVSNPENVSVYLLGGMIHDYTYSTWGKYAEDGLDFFFSNKLFFSCEGFDPDWGISCSLPGEAALTKKMIRSATKIILLADSTKFRRKGFCNICGFSDVDIIVTDSGLSEEARKEIRSLGVELIIA